MRRTVTRFALLLVVPLAAGVTAADVDFTRDVRPVLAKHCVSCHGARTRKAGLRVDAASLVRTGGESGPGVVPRKPGESLLLERITSTDPQLRMPAKADPLSAREIDIIRNWIRQGAVVPKNEVIAANPEDHWAWKKPKSSKRLKGTRSDSSNAVDVYLDALHKSRQLTPRPAARREHLLRRVYLDLVGLPPTREELREFLADDSASAYTRVVDRLLKSPHHGERWGRHWMDVWRYTDWFGLGKEVRYSQKSIWRWRDWIVESLNADLGYDRMVVDMLAADEIAPTDIDRLRATGFLTRNFNLFNRNYWLDDVVEHTAKAFMGLTLNCCRCHDHKYDPLNQEEYYSWRAFFEPYQVRLDSLTANSSPDAPAVSRVYDAKLDARTFFFIRGDEKNIDKNRKISSVIPSLFGSLPKSAEPVDLPPQAWYPGLRPVVIASQQNAIAARIKETGEQITAGGVRLKAQQVRLETIGTAKPTRDLFADDFKSARPKAWQAVGTRWSIVDGHLHNQNPTGKQSRYECRQLPPRDFVATSKFRITGGKTRSIGLCFDISQQGEFNVYLSPSGQQISLYQQVDGKESYPGRGKQAVKNGEIYELTIAVRDRLVNAWVNGRFRLAVKLPIPRRDGRLAVSTYQATADFFAFSFTALDPAVSLHADLGSGKDSLPPRAVLTREAMVRSIGALKQQQQFLEKSLEVLELEVGSLASRVAAERARYGLDKVDAKPLVNRAAADQRRLEIAAAELAVRRAERALAKGAGDGKAKTTQALKKTVDQARKTLEQKLAAKPGSDYKPLGKQYPRRSTGRRTALARWITSPTNPLTARVAVNHIWTRHFGQPLVDSMFDFGTRTSRPEHLELLDHLASGFMAGGWRMKDLHRVITLSRAYRRESKIDAADPAEATDPDNRLYRRVPLRQMEGEVMRDSLLALSGKLDASVGGMVLPSAGAENGLRRTIYYRYARDDKYKMLEIFDPAGVEECYRRHETVVPQQSLALANSRLVQTLAAAIGERLSAASHPEFVTAAYETILGRSPSAVERSITVEACKTLVDQLARQGLGAAEARTRAHSHVAHVLVMHNDFLVIR
ncbi:MAG: DUF1553 domain-containing protein [Planctomycetaceae bacterium]|nr:DUF1553 domain-containing protein [Planctomycetaceae bacterium]